MKFLTNFLQQGKTLWASLDAGARVTLLTFLGAAVVLIGVLSFWSSQPDYVLLYGGLTPEDAAVISTKLSDDKTPFKYEASRGAILVPEGKAEAARLNLASLGLPKNTTEGFEIFDKSTFGMTDFVQRINYQRALQGTLARNIEAIDVVDSARVSLSIPDDEIFAKEKKDAKASVVLRMKANRELGPEQIGAIRFLVASSVPKLDPKNVTIVDSAGRMLSKLQEEGSISGLSEDQLGVQKQIENHFTEKVQTMLDQVLGAGQSAVRVTAQLNLDRVERSSEKMDPESKVTLEESQQKEDSTGKAAGAGGPPGVTANTSTSATTSESASTASTHSHKTLTAKYHYDIISERTTAPVGSIKRLSVAVLVAPRPVKAVPAAAGAAPAPAAAPTARTAQELNALTEIVRSAVGYSPERQDSIKVDELAFSNDLAPEAVAAPAGAGGVAMELATRHLNDILAVVGIAIMAFVLRGMFNKSMPAPKPLPPALKPATGGGSLTQTSIEIPTLEKSVHVVMQEEVKQLVTENSTQAVSIIKAMMK